LKFWTLISTQGTHDGDNVVYRQVLH